ncbi:MAG: efflux RND transporter periplasmic adaptor subunit [Azoarcus sp.]|jgi:cobalt-zinc-cadmium efflux system membrane fusion protein|nr:efflux RND transporter periplasmic adaptor subunit [Azoarcus sp.]
MKNILHNKSLKITYRQGIAIAAILVCGLAAGASILDAGSPDAPGEAHDHASHGASGKHADAEHRDGETGGDHDHADEEPHGEGGPETASHAEEEGKIALSDEKIQSAAIEIRTAAPAKIRTTMQLPGEIRFDEDRTAHVTPRLAGIVESVSANLGQSVEKGQVLAVIASATLSELRSELLFAQKRLALARSTYAREKQLWEEKISAEQDYLLARQALREAEIAVANSRQQLVALGAEPRAAGNLNRYEIRAPFGGMIVEKHIVVGEAVKEDASIFTLSDLSSVWAEIVVPAKDLNRVRVGEKAVVRATAFDSQAEGRISYVGALLGQDTRSAKARVSLDNPLMAWRPGLFVNVELVSSEAEASVAVSAGAVQTVEDKPVVFIRTPEGFAAQPVSLGRADSERVEVLDGLAPGARYAAAGSFILKSELGKGSAEHSH